MKPTQTTVGPDARQSASGMTREATRAFIERRRQAFDDAEAVVESPMAGTHTGAHAVERALQALFDAFADLEMRTENLLIDGNSVVHVVGVEGTHTGEFMGLPPSGKPFSERRLLLRAEGRKDPP